MAERVQVMYSSVELGSAAARTATLSLLQALRLSTGQRQ